MSAETRDLIHAYYDSWTKGFVKARLRAVLARNLLFEGPIAGSRRAPADSFIKAVERFAVPLQTFRLIQELYDGDQAAVLYDLGWPAGTLRFGEFFRMRGGRIEEVRLVFDPAAFSRLESTGFRIS